MAMGWEAILKENLPRLRRLAVIYNADDPGKAVERAETEAAGRTPGLKMTAARIRDPREFEGAFAATRGSGH